MDSFKTVQKVKNHKITFNLPIEFKAEKVNVIVVPVEENDDEKEAKELIEKLLNGPTMTDEQYELFKEGSEHLRKWRD